MNGAISILVQLVGIKFANESNFLVYKGYSLYSVLIMPLFYQVRKTFLNQHF